MLMATVATLVVHLLSTSTASRKHFDLRSDILFQGTINVHDGHVWFCDD